MKQFYTIALLITALFGVKAQEINKNKLNSLFEIVDTNAKIMGSLSLFENGNEIYNNVIGYADVARNLPADHRTKYRIGSISKTFTAVLIMQLVENKKIKLEANLAKFFPKIPNAAKITIENLLRHQSGLFNFTNAEDYIQWMEKPATRNELIEIFRSQEPVFEPGEKSEYSNTNYVLLTFIIEDLTGKKYSDLIDERIVKPLGLENTYYGGKIKTEKGEALSYKKEEGWILNTETDMSVPQGAGALVSNPYDLNLFYTGLFEEKLVTRQSLDKMTETENGFGLGLFKIPFHEKVFYGHTGGIDGFVAVSAVNPQDDLAVSLCTNASEMSVNDLIIGVLSDYYGKDYELPSFGPALAIATEKLLPFEGEYSGENFSIRINVFVEEEKLMVQGTGQPAFPLEATAENKFKFAGLTMEFFPEKDLLILMQGGLTFELKRK